jgi:malate dehydrogenase (oxaloacetate-decarboxylating)
MSKKLYKFKYDEYGNTREIIVYGSGSSVSSLSFVNKGTAFNGKEREKLGLQASLPPSIRDLDDQIENTQRIVSEKVDDIERFIFIRALFDRNVTLAHALIKSDLEKYMGIVYTPTIGQAVQKYSSLYRQANGLHFYPGNIDVAEDILRRYFHRDIRVAVVTDNQGVLGIGDQGVGGIAVCLGKLMLYTQGSGIAPWHCLPISLDVGTDNETLLADKQYLGWRHKRLTGEEYLSFVGRFVRAFRNVFPDAVCQWENFSKQNAISIRNAFVDELISFNDNIQGMGAVALAAVLSAMRIKKERINEQVFLVQGAGADSIGVCEQLEAALKEEGLTEEAACDRIFLMDSAGVVRKSKSVELYTRKYAKDPKRFTWLKESALTDPAGVVQKAGVTVLVTTSDSSGITDTAVEAMLAVTNRPVILILTDQNPSNDAMVQDIYRWSKGKALLVSGNPLHRHGYAKKSCTVSQGNTILIFPGVGLGVLASGAREILPEFFTVAARTVSDFVTKKQLDEGMLLPAIADLVKVSNKVALAVAMCAVRHSVSRPCVFSSFQHQEDESRMHELILKMRWEPQYLPLIPM